MFDIKLIREQKDQVQSGLSAKNIKINLDIILKKDKKWRQILTEVEDLRSQKNASNDEIAQLKRSKKDADPKIASMKKISQKIGKLEPKIKEMEAGIRETLLGIPNLPHDSVPIGDVSHNEIVRSWGEPKKFDFRPKTHMEIAEDLGIIDFKRATKISGANFILYKNEGARFERALYNMMLDVHTQDHGYSEVLPPLLVNRESMTGTGQLPKMEEDMYKLQDDDLFLIPTAEVPVTNIHREEILDEKDLPISYTAYTACFRREAGSYGKDTKGLNRVHQFDKVELVRFVRPEESYDQLELLVNHAEAIFQLLDIPYRVVLLASGDLSFAAAKCYDLEGYAAGMDKWLEISSCSNFEDFQARRANIRFKGKETKKSTFVHTLNGSGVALPRTMIAILENNQTKEGEVIIPKALRPYMGGVERLVKRKT